MKPQEARQRRQAARDRALRPYESLHVSPARWAPEFVADVDRRLADGWSVGPIRNAALAPPVVWKTQNRSFDTHWHAWWPLDLLFAAAERSDGPDPYLDKTWPFAWDWLQTFQLPLLTQSLDKAVQSALTHDETQAWYDMSVGLRLHRLGYLTDLACRDDRRSDEEVGVLLAAMDFHNRLLLEDSLFKAHNNHGVFQALGQIAACRRFPDAPDAAHCLEVAEQRLKQCVAEHFLPGGIHSEHSPGYHLVLLDAFIEARAHGLLDEADLAWLDQAEAALAWMIMPGGQLAPFGDTDRTPAEFPQAYVERYRHPDVRALLTGGASGEGGMIAYPEAGYVFARQAGSSNGGYFAQQAGFHSRAHKHADHLNFVWSARGREILTDPGRFAYRGKTEAGSALWRDGFWYDDPRRVYSERTRAHNVVQIDDRDHPRMNVEPFGSALVSAVQTGGQIVTEASLELEPGVRWRRALVQKHNAFLVVIDALDSLDGVRHDFRQWFTLGPTWRRRQQTGAFVSREPTPLSLSVLALGDGAVENVWFGQKAPELQGWVAGTSQALTPACSLSVLAPGVTRACFITAFCFGRTTSAATPPSLDPDTLAGDIDWVVGPNTWTVRLRRDDAGVLGADFEIDRASMA